jgi:hypothetical protein
MGLQNVEKLPSEVAVQKKSLTFDQSLKYGLLIALVTAIANANAAMPDIETADILTYIGLLVAAVATVGSASLMIYLAAKGIKALRTAF